MCIRDRRAHTLGWLPSHPWPSAGGRLPRAPRAVSSAKEEHPCPRLGCTPRWSVLAPVRPAGE
eukprot:99378-Alexandrium_andersonii.AAC.1